MTPMLIAIATPILSFFFICSFQTTFHGSKARAKSIAAEYAVGMTSFMSASFAWIGYFSYHYEVGLTS